MTSRYDDRAVPGEQHPEKYKIQVGDNYKKFGEQTGWVYDPYTDKYYTEAQAQRAGIKQPKQAGLGSTLGTIAGVGLVAEGAKEFAKNFANGTLFGKNPTPSNITNPNASVNTGAGLTNTAQQSTGLFGLGGTPDVASTTAPEILSTTRLQPMGSAVMPDGSPGTLMSDGSIQPVNAPEGGGFGIAQGVQGGLGALQAVQGLQDLKKGNYLGGGINTTAGVANVGAALGSTTAANIAGYANPIAGAYGAYQTSKYIGDAAAGGKRNRNAAIGGATSGAAIGSAIPGVGTVAGAIIGALIGGVSSAFGSSKGAEQMQRDKIREAFAKSGLAEKAKGGHYFVKLADGSSFDIGVDGNAKLNNAAKNIDGNDKRHYFEVDFSNPLGAKSVELLQPKIKALLGEKASPKMVQDMIGYYSNAALSNAKDEKTLQANVNALLSGAPGGAAAAPKNQSASVQSNGQVRLSPGVYISQQEAKNRGLLGIGA